MRFQKTDQVTTDVTDDRLQHNLHMLQIVVREIAELERYAEFLIEDNLRLGNKTRPLVTQDT